MLKNGTYVAWFQTPRGQGTGIVHVEEGQICGRDGIMNYQGTYQLDGDRFTATVTTRGHTAQEGWLTVFGSHDDLELTLEGRCPGKIGHYVGTAKQFPGVLLEGTLILSEEQPPKPEADKYVSKFDPRRLPKLPRRAR
jgi:hypothetical protein